MPGLAYVEELKKKRQLDRRGSIPRSAAYEPSALTTELWTLAVAAVKRRPEQGRLEERECRLNQFYRTARIRKENVGRKACENFPGVGMRLSVKFEGDACTNVSVIPGQPAR